MANFMLLRQKTSELRHGRGGGGIHPQGPESI